MFLVLSGLATGLSWLCYFRALQLGPVSRVAPMDKLSVVFIIVFAAVILHEQLTWHHLVGGLKLVCDPKSGGLCPPYGLFKGQPMADAALDHHGPIK